MARGPRQCCWRKILKICGVSQTQGYLQRGCGGDKQTYRGYTVIQVYSRDLYGLGQGFPKIRGPTFEGFWRKDFVQYWGLSIGVAPFMEITKFALMAAKFCLLGKKVPHLVASMGDAFAEELLKDLRIVFVPALPTPLRVTDAKAYTLNPKP